MSLKIKSAGSIRKRNARDEFRSAVSSRKGSITIDWNCVQHQQEAIHFDAAHKEDLLDDVSPVTLVTTDASYTEDCCDDDL